MIVRTHRFKVGQSVNLIPSISRIAAQGHFEIVSLRPVEGETPHYRIKIGATYTNAWLRRLTSSCLRSEARLIEEWRDIGNNDRRKLTMFKILELKNADSAVPAEVGHGYSTREQALAAVKKHLTTFKAAGHNPEGNYWWVRDSEGLRKCWISSAD